MYLELGFWSVRICFMLFTHGQEQGLLFEGVWSRARQLSLKLRCLCRDGQGDTALSLQGWALAESCRWGAGNPPVLESEHQIFRV